jgi:hypothetical protein
MMTLVSPANQPSAVSPPSSSSIGKVRPEQSGFDHESSKHGWREIDSVSEAASNAPKITGRETWADPINEGKSNIDFYWLLAARRVPQSFDVKIIECFYACESFQVIEVS